MRKFCRIFETIKHGQILCQLRRDFDDGKPVIEWSMDIGSYSLDGICVEYENSDAGWGQAISAFEQFDTEMAFQVAEVIFKIEGNIENE